MDPKDVRPAEWPKLNVREMLRRLTAARVDFVVIGGIAMVLHGSARITRDLDVAFASGKANLERLGKVLVALDAQLRDLEAPLPFVPDARTLRNVQMLTLATSEGWLDVHRSVEGVESYASLRKNAQRVKIDDFTVPVASRDDLIGMKRAAGRDIDVADLNELAAMEGLTDG